DLLGLRTLSTLMRAWAIAKEQNPDGDCKGNPWGESSPEWFYSWQYKWNDYYEDKPVYQSLWSGRAKGIFQIEGSESMTDLVLGDPARVADAILALSRAANPPFRLVLGRYALEKSRKALVARAGELDAWEATSLSVDFVRQAG
ncbi:MAG: hypothetical protein ACKPGI_12845, partial [Verrucomicrobiota bacterium]